ncbi:hypothetical protein [Micromonospora chalcea]|uniref:hypothetical protein n=1 Tax=Micromonospora chalcea TaxID=1874 RepID=UPI0034549C40
MSPRPGGEADKLGNHYEGAWIVSQLLEVVAGRAETITVEPLGELGKGTEFALRRAGVVEVHQLKRQRRDSNYWTLADLRAEGVLEAARLHVSAGRQFHFVSTIPAQELRDLAERAQHSPDVQTFTDTLASKANQSFTYLVPKVYESAEVAWRTLRGTSAHWPDERHVRNTNAALAATFLDGAPGPVVAAALADLVVENLSNELDKQAIEEKLAPYELTFRSVTATPSLRNAVRDAVVAWKSGIEREVVRPVILRPEAEEISTELSGDRQCVFVAGAGGSGKSTVLLESVSKAESLGWVVLPLRLDRQEPFYSTHELGVRLRLGRSPVAALASMAGDRPSLLVVDQLDAVSKASGRMPQTFDAVADLVREATAFPAMRVLLACRKFDVDNDDRIRTLIKDHDAKQVSVAGLSDEQVTAAVQALDIEASRLSKQQRDLLRLPLHLKLLATIADQPEPFSFSTTHELFDAYWDRKRRDCRTRRGANVRFAEVVGALADEMSSRQSLTAPVSVLDDLDLADDADVLASEHVLVRDGRQYAFFHETFFDYAFARHWSRRGQTLVQFILAGEQELFRRAQVRQILTYLRLESPERFLSELEELLGHAAVRFHLKEVALGVVRSLEDPTPDEWQMVERLIGIGLSMTERLWLALRTGSWFDLLDRQGVLTSWLGSTDAGMQNRAVDLMVAGAREQPDKVAALLAPYEGQADNYPTWLRWMARFADLDKSRALFQLVVASTARGEHDGHEHELFMSAHDLSKRRPEWAIELLAAYLIDRPKAFELDESGKVKALQSRDYGALELLTGAASAEPAKFCVTFVPYMLDVMALTSRQTDSGGIYDRHFFFKDHEPPFHELEDALIVCVADALRKFVQNKPDEARPVLDRLADDPHEAAQWLLYEALAAGASTYAGYAVGLLLDRVDGLYAPNSTWTVRCLIRAISPELPDELFGRLERAILDFRASWEDRRPGRAQFSLLSGLDESRLSAQGVRRLGELRRLFGVEEPPAPEGVTGGFLGSPIPQEAAQRMNDEQWLRAIRKHHGEREDWTTLRGGARELSHVLKEEVKKDPGRFARLTLRFPRDVNPAYTDSLLLGLGEAEVTVDPELVFNAVRHVASFEVVDNDRWLGWALRPHLNEQIPADVMQLLVERALRSPSPEDDDTSDSSSDDEDDRRDRLFSRGINTARGACVEMLGNIVGHDPDGSRTAFVEPSLRHFAADPSLAVRTCVAHLLTACLRYARDEAVASFQVLIEADDRLLATSPVERLLVYVANGDKDVALPVIHRMLASSSVDVQKVGARLAAYAGLELRAEELVADVVESPTVAIRKGAAEVFAGRLGHSAKAAVAREALRTLVNDEDEEVRKAAATFPGKLRGKALGPYKTELEALIASPSFPHGLSQLLITLEHAPDRIDTLALKCAARFVEVHGMDAGDIRTGASAEAREVGELLLRAYAQAKAGSRGQILDLLDSLLLAGAYGVADLVDATER